jgi:phage-related baseplate assembly protein
MDRELALRVRHNDVARAVMLATSWGSNLDHIGATYFMGIARREGEQDTDYKARLALAPEAFSTAGPEGGYVFHALELDGAFDIADAAAYSEEDGATYSDTIHADAYSRGRRPTAFDGRAAGDPVLAPEILVVIHATTDYGPVDQALCDRCWDALNPNDTRPAGDTQRIEAAERIEYAVEMVLTYRRGADPAPLVAEAETRIAAYVAARERVGLAAERLGIGGAGYVSLVEAVTLNAPAADVGGGPKQVPVCTGITVTAVQDEGGWQ